MIVPLVLALQAAAPPPPSPLPLPAPSSQAPPSLAHKAPHYLWARDLLARCSTTAGADYCFGYIVAVYDAVRAYEAWLNLNEMCVPPGTTQGELVRRVTDHLRASPGDLDTQAASIVVVALQRSYPCPAAPTSSDSHATDRDR